MFERLSNGWELTKESMRVLRLDKELLLFPLVSGIACLLVLASFAVPLWQTGAFEAAQADLEQTQNNPLTYVVLFAFYFVNYFVVIFFNSALVACAVIRLKGGDPTVSDGLWAASRRLPQIAMWALVSATVGLLLKAIESRSERVGQIVSGLLGMAWSITTFFVIPVLVVENAHPWRAVSRSVSIMRKTWGESLTANFGISLITFGLILVASLPIIAGVAALANELVPLGIGLIALGVLLILLVSLISSALNAIILAALYIYAAEGRMPSAFDGAAIESAFTPRA